MTERGHPGRRGVYLVLAMAAFGFAVWLASYFIIGAQRRREDVRAGERSFVLKSVEEAVQQYRLERGVYPPGDGRGSADLARALQARSAHGMPYLNYAYAVVRNDGHLGVPNGPIIFYRCPGENAPFEVWAEPK